MESHINEIYADCATREDFFETCSRINLWILCDLDPETAMEYLRRQGV